MTATFHTAEVAGSSGTWAAAKRVSATVNEGDAWVIKTSPEGYQAVKDAVDAAKLPQIEAKLIMAPSTSTQLSGDKLKSFLKLLDLLEDNDDVQNVWHNWENEE